MKLLVTILVYLKELLKLSKNLPPVRLLSFLTKTGLENNSKTGSGQLIRPLVQSGQHGLEKFPQKLQNVSKRLISSTKAFQFAS